MACNNCRRRKVRCDNQPQTCSNCKLYNVVCHYSQDKRRRPGPSVAGNGPGHTHRADSESFAHGYSPFTSFPTANQHLPSENDINSTGDPHSTIEVAIPSDSPVQNGRVSPSVDLPTRNVVDAWMGIVDGQLLRGIDSTGYSQAKRMGFTEMQSTSLDQDVSRTSENLTRPRGLVACEHFQSPPGSATIPRPTSSLRPSLDNHMAVASVYDVVGMSTKSPTETGVPVLESLPKHWATQAGLLRRVGRGDLRYFGVTSNLDLDRNAVVYGPYSSKGRRLSDSCEKILNASGLHWGGDKGFEDYLTTQFSLCENTLLKVLDESIYLRERIRFGNGEDTDLCSPTLINAVCALGALHSTRPFPTTIPLNAKHDFFAARARALLDMELDHPTLATAQALVILSYYEAGRGGDSRGWLYSGMAARISVELGLQFDGQDDVKPLTMDTDILQLRRGLFWAIRATSVFWSCYLGRPLTNGELEPDLSRPLVDAEPAWSIATPEPAFSTPSEVQVRMPPAAHQQFCTLVAILVEIQRTLYSGRAQSPQDQLSFVTSMNRQLREWKNSLPLELRVNTSSAPVARSHRGPTVFHLHMHYHSVMILLHRSSIAPSDNGLPSQTRSDEELQTCIDSADAICLLLKMYRSSFPTNTMHVQSIYAVLTAGLIHVHKFHQEQISQSRGETSTASDNLATCLQTLGEMSTTFKSSLRAMDILLSARRQLSREW